MFLKLLLVKQCSHSDRKETDIVDWVNHTSLYGLWSMFSFVPFACSFCQTGTKGKKEYFLHRKHEIKELFNYILNLYQHSSNKFWFHLLRILEVSLVVVVFSDAEMKNKKNNIKELWKNINLTKLTHFIPLLLNNNKYRTYVISGRT